MVRIHCNELGIADCDWVASGETPADVIDEAVAHLRNDHGLDMPDTETILEGDYVDDPDRDDADNGVGVMVRRLREALGLERRAHPAEARPTIGRTPQR